MTFFEQYFLVRKRIHSDTLYIRAFVNNGETYENDLRITVALPCTNRDKFKKTCK